LASGLGSGMWGGSGDLLPKSSAAERGDGLVQNRVIGAGHGLKVEMMDETNVRGVKTAAQVERINRALQEGRLAMPK
jgi:CMP-2-keto-3-deoxyoctulosonic acid synthetase